MGGFVALSMLSSLLMVLVVGAIPVVVIRKVAAANAGGASVAAMADPANWPGPGSSLPVIVDRANPKNFAIQWNRHAGGDSALDEAEALDAAMRARKDGPRA